MSNYFNWLVEQETGKRWIHEPAFSSFKPDQWLAEIKDAQARDTKDQCDVADYYYLKAGDAVFVFTADRSSTANVVIDVVTVKKVIRYAGREYRDQYHHTNKIKGFRNCKLIDYSKIDYLAYNAQKISEHFKDVPLVLVESVYNAYEAEGNRSKSNVIPMQVKLECLENPDLSSIGLQGLFSENPQIIQELAMFLLNDTVANSTQTDKEKVVSHGFDVKKSFRH
jgi:hypothetical protein